jgi:hypothetical protein
LGDAPKTGNSGAPVVWIFLSLHTNWRLKYDENWWNMFKQLVYLVLRWWFFKISQQMNNSWLEWSNHRLQIRDLRRFGFIIML